MKRRFESKADEQHNKKSSLQNRPARVFCDGAGARPDGTGSGFAWVQPETGQKHVQRQEGLTNNEAEYQGLLSAVESLPDGARAEICSDSQLMCCQFNGSNRVLDPKLSELLLAVRRAIERKRLDVVLKWIPRSQNLAGKLL